MTKTVVNLVGFDLTFSSGITIDDFFHWMVMSEEKPIKVNGYTNYIFSDIVGNYIVGLIICYKGDKKLLATRQEEGSFAVYKIELKSDQESTQASIFCIDPTSRSGMFYSYHGGVSKVNFANVFKNIHDQIKKSKIKEKTKELSKLSKASAKNKSDANTSYIGNFTFNLKIRKLDIDTLLSEFSEYNELEITLSPAIEPAPAFRPLQHLSSSFKTIVRLDGKKDNSEKRNAIKSLWHPYKQGDTIKALKIAGKALYGTSLDAKIGENIEHYRQIYLDDYIDTLPDTKWTDYKTSKAIDLILETVKEHPLVIPKPAKVSSWKTSKNKKDIATNEESREPELATN